MWYQLRVVGRSGMYCNGELAGSPDMAKRAVGTLIPQGLLLCVVEYPDRYVSDGTVIVEMESLAGQWTIGVPGGNGYREGK